MPCSSLSPLSCCTAYRAQAKFICGVVARWCLPVCRGLWLQLSTDLALPFMASFPGACARG